MKIHGNNVIRSSAGKEVSNQRASLSYPLSVTDLGLKGWRLRGRLPHKTIDTVGASRAVLAVEVCRFV